jgi:DNA invertase Pin-like site-specific DNA recombinase
MNRPATGRVGKVQAWHQDRLAVVYVRQSTRQQVLEHGESTRLQYGLTSRAEALGWASSRILVIDEDLGRSGAGTVDRPGFQRLVTEITMGRVGLVLGIEMSRLARTGRDWHQLIELCSLARALLADADGVYDPNEYNDRLLLGLKGTMSEVELHLIKQRMRSGVLAKAARGELALPVPTGYVRRASGEVAFDPDEQVCTVVRLVLRLFQELGTVNAVLRHLAEHQVQLGFRRRSGPDKGELVWARPNRNTLQNILHHPIYAGVYVYGRSRHDPGRKRADRPYSGRIVVPAEDWLVWIPGVFPAYLSLDQWERNQARLADNRAWAQSRGAVRGGAALLTGLLRCGMCGRRMTVRYQSWNGRKVHSYVCARQRSDLGLDPCQQMAGAFLDEWVTDQALSTLTPAALELSAHAAEQIEAERAEMDRLWRQRLQRADYQAALAKRRYEAVDPDNRLVAHGLEADWETTLAEQARLADDYARFTDDRPLPLTAAELTAIAALAGDVPALWHAATTTTADRKELLRCIIDKISVVVDGDSENVRAEITWAGGATTPGDLVRPVATLEQLSYFPRLAELVRQLAGRGLPAAAIAEAVNSAGLRPPKRVDHYTADTIRELMKRLAITPARTTRTGAAAPQPGPGEWWINDLAREIGMPPVTLYCWLRRGWVTGRQEATWPRRWYLQADEQEINRLRAMHNLPASQRTRRRNPELSSNKEEHDGQAARTRL